MNMNAMMASSSLTPLGTPKKAAADADRAVDTVFNPAHIGAAVVAALRAADNGDDDDDKKKDSKRSKAQDDDNDDEDKKKDSKKSRAQDDDDDDDKKKDTRKTKKAAEDDKKKDDENEEGASRGAPRVVARDDDIGDRADYANPALAAARARERGRFASIMSSEAAGKYPAAAIRLALSDMPRSQVTATLDALTLVAAPTVPVPANNGSALRDRVAQVQVPQVGPNDKPQQQGGIIDDPKYAQARATADLIIRADKMRRGEAVD